MFLRKEALHCTHNVSDVTGEVASGTISFCKVPDRPHFFVLFQSKDKGLTVAFSYVPDSCYQYVARWYEGRSAIEYVEDDGVPASTLSGYNPFRTTESHVVDTWKLTDSFVRLLSADVAGWRFRRYASFNRYNVAALLPLFRFTDCIGYSMYHFYKAIAKDPFLTHRVSSALEKIFFSRAS